MDTSNKIVIVLTNNKFLKSAQQPQSSGVIASAFSALTGSNNENAATAQPHMQTGFDIRELAQIYRRFEEMKMLQHVTFASPQGGEAPIDDWARRKADEDRDSQQVRRLLQSQEFMQKLKRTEPCERINVEQVAAVVLLGGLGALGDFPESKPLQNLLRQVWKHGEQKQQQREKKLDDLHEFAPVIAAISEGTAALVNLPEIVKGRRVACTSNDELREAKFHDKVPLMPEDKLRQAGAKIEKADAFSPNVVISDERLITAQNYASANEFAERIVEAIERNASMNKPEKQQQQPFQQQQRASAARSAAGAQTQQQQAAMAQQQQPNI